jgi:Predicted AAA-ATPase/PD-(D/E)XK nuclease superfamily
MAQKYPVGLQDFSEIRTGRYVYVDKTLFAHKLIDQGKYYFLSRPRRFGKSLFISTMDYLFKGHKEVFEGLYIYDKWDWTKTNPVINISFNNIGHQTLGLEKAIQQSLNETAQEYDCSFSQTAIDQKFKELIETLSAKYGKVVVLIDEYDKPIIDYLGTDEAGMAKAKENRDILKSFYSILKNADPYLKLVFITGVSKFSKVSIFSDLNNLKDLTIDTQFEGICGITQTELESHFVEELVVYDPEKIKKWYNGYSWGGKNEVYNPFSLLNFFSGDGSFKNYWFTSGTPTFLANLSKKYQQYDFESIEIIAAQLDAYDLDRLQLIPIMFQTGYLTVKAYDAEYDLYTLGYPNEEIRRSYLDFLADAYTQSPVESVTILALEIRKALNSCNFDKVERIFNSIFKSIPYQIWQHENEPGGVPHYYHALIHLTFRLLGIYAESEVQSSDGRLDSLVQLENHAYCFEFKLDGSAEVALQQIKDKGYLQPYLHSNKTCIGIGLNFSSATKKVEKLLWEQLL